MDISEKLKTIKDYQYKKAPVAYAVLTKEGVVMASDFIDKEEAEDFRDNSYFGYYKNCDVKPLTPRYSGI